jgi:hypothetical protein
MADIQQVKTSSALIVTGKGILSGIIASVSAASSQATLTCYDNTSASGTVLFQIELYSGCAPFVLFFGDRFAPRFTTGLYLSLDANLVAAIYAGDR